MFKKYTSLLHSLDSGILTITINRPDKLNALNAAVFTELDIAMDEVIENADIKSVIITGAGRGFCSGMNVAAEASGEGVLRTVYLLRWISSKEMRQEVSATTNKIESYHAFTKWLDFGGDVITENDPNEQQKRVRLMILNRTRFFMFGEIRAV